MEPVLLYPMLRSMGMIWERQPREDTVVELLIWEPAIPGDVSDPV
jgi:hypothetical protein